MGRRTTRGSLNRSVSGNLEESQVAKYVEFTCLQVVYAVLTRLFLVVGFQQSEPKSGYFP